VYNGLSIGTKLVDDTTTILYDDVLYNLSTVRVERWREKSTDHYISGKKYYISNAYLRLPFVDLRA